MEITKTLNGYNLKLDCGYKLHGLNFDNMMLVVRNAQVFELNADIINMESD